MPSRRFRLSLLFFHAQPFFSHPSLPNVTSNVLKKVLEWCEHHKKDPEPVASSIEDHDDSRKKTTEISDWDQKFIQVDQEMLFEIILAANYLDIKPLL